MANLLPLSDEYELVHVLGAGWAGETWLARLRHPRFGLAAGSEVALKRYKSVIFKQAINIADRIEREATLGATVKHNNLVRVYALEKFQEADGQEVWALLMSLCSGGDLAKYIREHYPLSSSDVRRISQGLSSGLAALHAAGVTHRDIKPENVLIDSDGNPRIGDFGVIRHVDEVTITGSAEFLGTIRYAAPEVLKADGATQASDVYSLGAVFYQLLYGHRPYDAVEMFSVVVASVLAAPPALPVEQDRFGAAISLECLNAEAVCKRMLSAAPEDRPTADTVERWLREDASEPFLDEVAKALLPTLNKHLYDWSHAAGRQPTIFSTYCAWRLARALSHADAVEYLRTGSRAIIEKNVEYMAVALAYIPKPQEYPSLSRHERAALVRSLQHHQEAYVREIWDDRSVMANRDSSYLATVRAFAEVETDPELLGMLQSMRYVTPWAEWDWRNSSMFD